MKLPHFGLQFEGVDAEEAAKLTQRVDSLEEAALSSFRVFRTDADKLTVYVGDQPHDVVNPDALNDILPKVFRIDPTRAIPNSVPISFLIDGGARSNADPGPARAARWAIIDPIVAHASELLKHLGDAQGLTQAFQSATTGVAPSAGFSSRESDSHRSELDLAYDLLVTVDGIDVSAFGQLRSALRNNDEGLANGIVASMNDRIERSLNLRHWWSQDEEFRLAITVRDFDIVFTIRDRTGSEYSFAERSSGMKYFLSYLAQFLAHASDRTTRGILLMDEPDAYLSNEGQQDLLRLLHEFTLPTDTAPGGQVVYVTHSPFLIDKNRADRIRVLDKGTGDEGVRVVRDVGRNHFEPLRTALGGFVGETSFIGNCNLLLEGMADQIYLAGMSELLGRLGVATTECLDLNRITLVPAGSASHVPYLTFLARGRDSDKPAVIVLLDGDHEGNLAEKELRRGGPRNKQLVRPEYVAQLKPDKIPGVTSERPRGPLEIEDLIPVDIAIAAAKAYFREMRLPEPEGFPSPEQVRNSLSEATGVLGAVQAQLDDAGGEIFASKRSALRVMCWPYSQQAIWTPPTLCTDDSPRSSRT